MCYKVRKNRVKLSSFSPVIVILTQEKKMRGFITHFSQPALEFFLDMLSYPLSLIECPGGPYPTRDSSYIHCNRLKGTDPLSTFS